VNTASVQELDAHPYISPKIANIIVSYRQQHGKYTSIENLYNIRVLDKATLEKLTPYLSFE
jgi:competence ComEA-like helix-hairpin-helix protein